MVEGGGAKEHVSHVRHRAYVPNTHFVAARRTTPRQRRIAAVRIVAYSAAGTPSWVVRQAVFHGILERSAVREGCRLGAQHQHVRRKKKCPTFCESPEPHPGDALVKGVWRRASDVLGKGVWRLGEY